MENNIENKIIYIVLIILTLLFLFDIGYQIFK